MKRAKSHGRTGMVVLAFGALGFFTIVFASFVNATYQPQPVLVQPRIQRMYVHIDSNPPLGVLRKVSTLRPPSHAGEPLATLRFADPALQRTVVTASDGSIWFASLYNGNQRLGLIERVVRYDKGSGQATILKVPVPRYGDVTEVSAGTRDVWFTAAGADLVGHLAGDGTVVEFPSKFQGTLPDFPVVAPDGSVWFAELGIGKIAHLDLGGHIQEFPRQGAFASLGPLTRDQSGDLWFLDPKAGAIGHLQPATGIVGEFAVPLAATQLTDIAAAPNGAIWFVDAGHHALGRLDPSSHQIVEFPQPEQYSPRCLAVSGSGVVWFCVPAGIGRFDPATDKTTIIPLMKRFPPYRIAAGFGDDIWFTSGGGIGRTNGDGSVVQRYLPDYQLTSYHVTTYTKDPDAFMRRHPHYGGDLELDVTGPERRVVEYTDVSSDLTFNALAFSPEGKMWLVDNGTLAEFDPAARRVTKSLRHLGPESDIVSVVADHHGRVWAAEQNRLIRFNTSGIIDRIIYPPGLALPNDMTVGADDSLWLALFGEIVNLRADGSSKTYPVGEEGPLGLAAASNGKIWFTTRSHIGRLHIADGTMASFALPYLDAAPMAVTSLPDGSVWFTDAAGRIGRVSENGHIEEFPIPTRSGVPFGLSHSPSGKLWFTEFYSAKLGVFDTLTKRMEEIPIPWADSFPLGITVDETGWIRFSDANGILGQYDPTVSRFHPTVIPTPLPPEI